MATKTSEKKAVEILLVSAEINGVPEKGLPRSRNILQVDLIWPKTGTAKKSAAREIVLKKGKADFTSEPWAKRCFYREEIETRCGIAVSVTEPISVQKLKQLARLTAKYALKMGADFVEKAMVGYADIASAPVDAIASMLGEKDAPAAIAQGVIDYDQLPAAGEEVLVEIPLERPLTHKSVGRLILLVRG